MRKRTRVEEHYAVRRAVLADAPAVAELHLCARHTAVPAIPPLVHPERTYAAGCGTSWWPSTRPGSPRRTGSSSRPERLSLWTFQSNLGARRFYERHGFVAVECTECADNEEGEHDVRYVWHRHLS